MNNMPMNQDLLWDYADGLLDAATRREVEAFIKQHPEWQAQLHAIQQEKATLFGAPLLEKPAPGFADHVMAAWAGKQVESLAVQAQKQGRDWIVTAITAVFGLFIAVPLIAFLWEAVKSGWQGISVDTPELLPTVAWEQWAQLPVLQYAASLLLTFLALRLAERVLLQTFAAKKAVAQ